MAFKLTPLKLIYGSKITFSTNESYKELTFSQDLHIFQKKLIIGDS
jgi:hypothetical protein